MHEMSTIFVNAEVPVVVSSAYVGADKCLSQSWRSDTKSTKMRGDRTPPWGTPLTRLAKLFGSQTLYPINFCEVKTVKLYVV